MESGAVILDEINISKTEDTNFALDSTKIIKSKSTMTRKLGGGYSNRLDKRNTAVDILKGICILFVIITHLTGEKARTYLLYSFWIDMAVPIFMFLSGYVGALSFKKSKAPFFDRYRIAHILPKAIRFTLPFIVVFLIEEITYFVIGEGHQISETIFAFLQGGYGPGSYYYPLMMQFIFVFPVIFTIIERFELKGLYACAGINFMYEILKTAYMMNEDCYRLLIFRYVFIIAAGCFFANGGKFKNKFSAWILTAVGALYISVVTFTAYKPIVFVYWTGTGMFATMFIIPFTMWAIKKNFKFLPLELLGKASYNIFLVQMAYCIFWKYTFIASIESTIVRLSISAAICVIVGFLFYLIETPITTKIMKTVQKRLA